VDSETIEPALRQAGASWSWGVVGLDPNPMTTIFLTDEPKHRPPAPRWRSLVISALENLGGEASLDRLYAKVKELAPTITAERRHWKAKVRQIVQRTASIENVSRGVWRLRPSVTRATKNARTRRRTGRSHRRP
jgi:hypothetical protein